MGSISENPGPVSRMRGGVVVDEGFDAARVEAEHQPPPRRQPPVIVASTRTNWGQRVVWALAVVAIIVAAFDAAMGLQLAESAPQQAAGAAMGAFYVITIYTVARAITEIIG